MFYVPWWLLYTIPSHCPAPNPLPYLPSVEKLAFTLELIYNVIKVAKMYLQTLCCLCLCMLLWTVFLFPQKHLLYQPQRTRQTSNGICDLNKIILLFFINDKLHHWKFRENQKNIKRSYSSAYSISSPAHWAIMFRFCCWVGIIPHEIQTEHLTPHRIFFLSKAHKL